MLCSTIIPTINRHTLERSVRSALDQDLGIGLHEILVFNNSSQRLPETDWLISPQITIVNSHANYHYATNRGAKMASGKYINFLDDDDFLMPGSLKALSDKAIHAECDWVYGSFRLVDDNGRLISVVPAGDRGNLLGLFIGGENLHFAASLIRRDAFLKAGGMDPHVLVWNDLDLCCQIALSGDFDYINQIVATVRLSGGTGSSFDYSALTQDYRRIREKVFNSDKALARIQDSVKDKVFLRGRACRAYLISAVLNLFAGDFVMASGRLISLFRLTGFHLTSPNFWRGLLFKTYWHAAEKKRQEDHFLLYQQSNNNEQ